MLASTLTDAHTACVSCVRLVPHLRGVASVGAEILHPAHASPLAHVHETSTYGLTTLTLIPLTLQLSHSHS